jgi:RNA polymerase sigma factor (sigma-70 family)
VSLRQQPQQAGPLRHPPDRRVPHAASEVALTSRERTVLHLRFEDDLTQREIGRRLGISQMNVSRVMRVSLRRILEAVVVKEWPWWPETAAADVPVRR